MNPGQPEQRKRTVTKAEYTLAEGREILLIPDFAVSRGSRLDKVLARASDAPLRAGNRLALLKNGPHTYDDWIEAISRAKRWIGPGP